MTKDNETGLFDLNDEGVYVDYINTDDEKEAITSGKGTQFFDAAIIPTVQYQVYGLDNAWFWDDEGQNYTGVPEGSDILVQTVVGTKKSYYSVNDLNDGDGKTTLNPGTPLPDAPSGKTKELGGGKSLDNINLNDPDDPNYPDDGTDPSVGDIYYQGDNEKGYEYIEVKGTMEDLSDPSESQIRTAKKLSESPETEEGSENTYEAPINSTKGEVFYDETEVLSPGNEDGDGTKSGNRGGLKGGDVEKTEGKDGDGDGDEGDTTLDVTTPYEFNKYQSSYGKMAKITITPSQTLKSRYPYAVVTINGKEYDLKYLNNPIDLYMDKDYKISINWVWGSVVETFRIICNK
jgi:hypothetical protein